MIVYQSTKADFVDTANTRDIEAVILEAFEARMGRRVAPNEVRSWKESLQAMSKVLNDELIPDDTGVAVEYGIPQTSKRVDMLLSGRDEAGRANLIIIELKQWERATRTSMDAVVRTRFAHGESDCSHPSYQSWSYAELLRNFNETIDNEDVPLQPCAYLHNCRTGGRPSRSLLRALCRTCARIPRRRRRTSEASRLHRATCSVGRPRRVDLPNRPRPHPPVAS